MGEASREIMRQARQRVPEWTPSQVREALADGQDGAGDQEVVLVDVREKLEWNEGHIPGAIHVPRGYLELQIEEAVPDKSKTVVLYCAGGVRSLMAGQTLKQMGYSNPISISGGFGQWKNNGFPFVQPRTMSEAQSKRYSRHLLIPEVGEEGQLTVFKPNEGPCYRCLYPEPPPTALAPSCAEAGVLGVLPGVIGLLQAVEAIKLLLGIGDPLVGRMMTYDALAGEFSELRLFRDPECPACGENADPEDLPTYAEVCAIPVG